MSNLTAIKLEPKIEIEGSDNSSVECVADFENQPSSSTSINTFTANFSDARNNYSDSDSDDITEDTTGVVNSKRTEQVLEVVEIDSDTSEESNDDTVQTPRKSGLRQLKRRSFKVMFYWWQFAVL